MSDMSNSTVSISQLARREKMVNSIAAGFPFQLRLAAKVNDRSAPRIEGAYIKKVYDRRPLMNSIRGAVKLRVLKYSQINDRSGPKIDPNVHIQFVERKDFLDNVLSGAHNFYERLLTAVSTGAKTAGDVASFAQAKAGALYEKGLSTASEVSAVAKETAQSAQAKAGGLVQSGKEKATDLIESSQDKAASLRSSASRKVRAVRYTWNDLYTSGKEKLLSRQSIERNSDAHRQLIADISANRQQLLTHVHSKDINDRSKPFIPAARGSVTRLIDNRNRVLNEIQHKATVKSLHHVSTRDSSCPMIGQVSIKQHDRKALMADLQAESVKLHHTTAVSDRSAPALPQGKVAITSNTRQAVLNQVQKGIELHHNNLVMDRSAPQLPSM